MSGELPISKREQALLETPDGMARIVWRRLYRNLRLWARAETAEIEHHFLFGDPTKARPTGILNAGGLL